MINVKNMTHLVYLFIQILKKKNLMEEKDSKRANILVPLLIDDKQYCDIVLTLQYSLVYIYRKVS